MKNLKHLKPTKALALSRETLRILSASDLKQVAGGGETNSNQLWLCPVTSEACWPSVCVE